MKEKNSKMGRPAKKPEEPNNIQMNIRISKGLLAGLRLEASRVGVSVPDCVRGLLEYSVLPYALKNYIEIIKKSPELPEDYADVQDTLAVIDRHYAGIEFIFHNLDQIKSEALAKVEEYKEWRRKIHAQVEERTRPLEESQNEKKVST